MAFDYAAFLSYSHRDAPWVEVLQNNLETSLQALGHHPSDVFRDETDFAPGRSWVTGLQQGLDRAPKVIPYGPLLNFPGRLTRTYICPPPSVAVLNNINLRE